MTEEIIYSATGADVGHRRILGDPSVSLRCRFGFHSSSRTSNVPGFISWKCVRCGEETRLKIPRCQPRPRDFEETPMT